MRQNLDALIRPVLITGVKISYQMSLLIKCYSFLFSYTFKVCRINGGRVIYCLFFHTPVDYFFILFLLVMLRGICVMRAPHQIFFTEITPIDDDDMNRTSVATDQGLS